MPEGVIRLALAGDQPRIEAIVAAAYRPYLQRMTRPPGPMVDDYAHRIAERQVYVLEHGCEILGILVLEPAANHLLLDNIAVDPDHHGQGLGRQLMAFTEVEARRQGYCRIVLYTNEVMVENIRLYDRLGYLEIERRVVRGYNRVYMQKVLS